MKLDLYIILNVKVKNIILSDQKTCFPKEVFSSSFVLSCQRHRTCFPKLQFTIYMLQVTIYMLQVTIYNLKATIYKQKHLLFFHVKDIVHASPSYNLQVTIYKQNHLLFFHVKDIVHACPSLSASDVQETNEQKLILLVKCN